MGQAQRGLHGTRHAERGGPALHAAVCSPGAGTAATRPHLQDRSGAGRALQNGFQLMNPCSTACPHAQPQVTVILKDEDAHALGCQAAHRPLERERVKALSVQLRTEVERWLCCVSGAAMQLGLHVLLAFKMSTYGTSYRASISSTVSRGTLSLPSCPGWLESSAHISSNAWQRPNIAVPVSLAMAACTRCLERCRQAGRPAGGVGCPRNRTHRCQHSRDRWWAPSSHSSAGSPLVLERHVGGEEGVARVYQLRKGAQVGLHAVHLNAALGGLDGRRHLQSK